MDIQEMLNTSALGSSQQLSATGSVVGGLVGSVIPGVGTLVGSGIGGMIGGVASNFIPKHSYVKGSVSGVNFTVMNKKPYYIKYVVPSVETQKKISDYYCYFGCATCRTEPLNIGSYIYNKHAYIQGELEYNGTIPHDKFQKINVMFKRGIHILNG